MDRLVSDSGILNEYTHEKLKSMRSDDNIYRDVRDYDTFHLPHVHAEYALLCVRVRAADRHAPHDGLNGKHLASDPMRRTYAHRDIDFEYCISRPYTCCHRPSMFYLRHIRVQNFGSRVHSRR